jgi:hypothetical protein
MKAEDDLIKAEASTKIDELRISRSSGCSAEVQTEDQAVNLINAPVSYTAGARDVICASLPDWPASSIQRTS